MNSKLNDKYAAQEFGELLDSFIEDMERVSCSQGAFLAGLRSAVNRLQQRADDYAHEITQRAAGEGR